MSTRWRRRWQKMTSVDESLPGMFWCRCRILHIIFQSQFWYNPFQSTIFPRWKLSISCFRSAFVLSIGLHLCLSFGWFNIIQFIACRIIKVNKMEMENVNSIFIVQTTRFRVQSLKLTLILMLRKSCALLERFFWSSLAFIIHFNYIFMFT